MSYLGAILTFRLLATVAIFCALCYAFFQKFYINQQKKKKADEQSKYSNKSDTSFKQENSQKEDPKELICGTRV